MKYINKYSVGGGIILGIILLGGLYTADIFEDKIVVTLPSDICNDATLRVTKDDFTLKCGRRIAFQADTIVEYYKTYGIDEWVRNNRYVGRNKKDITLELIDKGDSFDIVKTTKYRKGRQSILDGILKETYTFTKDKVKITYDYIVDNNAEHKITMGIKKQYKSYLDAFDPNGYSGILSENTLSYKGFGDLFIDPVVDLSSPTTLSTAYIEGDTVPFICNYTATGNETIDNVTFYWIGANNSWSPNGTTDIDAIANGSVTFSRIIPHRTINSSGTILWNCQVCNTTANVSAGECAFNETNYTLDVMYAPNAINIISPEDDNLNLLNSTGWGLATTYATYYNATPGDGHILINWTHPGHPDGLNVTYNLSHYGVIDSVRNYTYFFNQEPSANSTIFVYWNFSNLPVDDYYITLEACTLNGTTRKSTLCVDDTIAIPIEIFDYTPSITTGESKIRYSTQPTVTKTPALGQTNSKGIITIDWLGNSNPTGIINLSLNISDMDACTTFYFNTEDNSSGATSLTNNTKSIVYGNATADPNYIWLWVTKASCGTTTISNTYNFEVFDE